MNNNPKEIYQYKGKPYEITTESKMKISGEWKDVIIYKCLYYNPDGETWVRSKEEFFTKFKIKENNGS